EIKKCLGPVTSVMRDVTAIMRFDVSKLRYNGNPMLDLAHDPEPAFAFWHKEASAHGLTPEVLEEAIRFAATQPPDWPQELSSKGIIEKARSLANSALGLRYWLDHLRARAQQKHLDLSR